MVSRSGLDIDKYTLAGFDAACSVSGPLSPLAVLRRSVSGVTDDILVRHSLGCSTKLPDTCCISRGPDPGPPQSCHSENSCVLSAKPGGSHYTAPRGPSGGASLPGLLKAARSAGLVVGQSSQELRLARSTEAFIK